MILLTGATGYIGQRLLPLLVNQGMHVLCAVRDKDRFSYPPSLAHAISVIEIDFLTVSSEELTKFVQQYQHDITGAYYLLHSMSSKGDFEQSEIKCAEVFKAFANQLRIKHVIYLSGIVNAESLSKHLQSRKQVEEILKTGTYGFTCLRAGIIIGSGSASFEIIRDLVEKLPVMVAPKWLRTRCQPIAIRNVLQYLTRILLNAKYYDQTYDIGGPDVLSYKRMLLQYSRAHV